MKHSILYLLITLLLPIGSFAQSGLITNTPNRSTTSLNGKWHYIIDPYENGYYNYRLLPFDEDKNPQTDAAYYTNKVSIDGRERVEYNFGKSATMNVPGDWNSQLEELKWYEGTVWYQKSFDYNLAANKRLFIYFGAVNYEANVYLNGVKLGKHVGGFTPFNYEITSLVKAKDNFIVVKVDNKRKPEAVPTVNTDWWNYGGITRDVLLVEESENFVIDYSLQLDKGSNSTLKGFVKIDGTNLAQTVTLSIPELKINQQIKTNDAGIGEFTIKPKNIELWSVLKPKRYDVTISCNGSIMNDKIGFRTIETKGSDVLLNGKPLFLRGICIHEEIPQRQGRAYSETDARMLLGWAKELNCNFVRLAHYPHNENMARVADKMGILVWEEVPVYWTIHWTNKATEENARQQLTDMITRDKNRASVIVWSVGNETPVSEVRNSFMSGLTSLARSLDSTRLVAAALEVDGSHGNEKTVNDPLGKSLDFISFNEYIGWYGGTPLTCDDIIWKFSDNKPVLISEFGGEALQGFHGDKETIWTEESQAYFYEHQINMLKKITQLRAVCPWILVDFKSPRRAHPQYQEYWNRKGLLGETGAKKKAFYLMKAYYDEMEKLHPDN